MTPERYRQIGELYHAALEVETDQRAAFLERGCAGDVELRREVESLINSHKEGKDFIAAPALAVAAELLAAREANALTGQTIGRYRVLSLIGAGGMGRVYLAEDTGLGRRVALKLLPEYFTHDKNQVQRFRQEARAASALNHPSILTVHEVGQVDGTQFIATEYVEGETLRARLMRAPFSLHEALDVAAQVADALVAAHHAGIVHRDIKPENIMLRTDGYVKVLDFGLAKLTETRESAIDTAAPPFAPVNTEVGIVMGTVSYMSPEQARGLKIDARTDIWSLGCVLYEMLAGRVPFQGETTSDVLASILTAEPPSLNLSALEASSKLQRIVSKALCKDKEERYKTARDLLIDLKTLRRRLDFETELDRTAGPDAKVYTSTAPSGGPDSAASAAKPSARTSAASAAPTVSRADKLVGEVKRHKVAVTLALAAFIVIAVGIAYFYSARAGRTINSLAVLPLVNAGNDPDAEYLSEGITESLINSLSQLPGLKVMSRNSVFRYKGRDVDAREVGRELGVEAVLTGRIVQHGDGLSISVELVNARDDTHIWGEQYSRKLSDLLAVQGEISREVLEKLRLRLTGEEERRATRNYTENTEAYQLYLKGRYYWNKRTEEGLEKSIEYFRQAIDKDPTYARAYAGLADSYSLLGNYGRTPGAEVYPQAKAAALKALELDDTLGEAHASLAYLKSWYEWDFEGADRHYKQAIELNPNYSTAHHWYAFYLEIGAGRPEEAIAEMKRAKELDPLSLIINSDTGTILYLARHYDEAAEQCKRTLEMDASFALARHRLGVSYVQKGMYKEAVAELRQAVADSNQQPMMLGSLAHALAVSGDRGGAKKVLGELTKLSARRNVSYDLALVYSGLGEKEEALKWLERAVEQRDFYITWLKVEPRFDPLHSDPRFADLVHRIGLPQ